ncbi:MAG: DnaJ domain-containing protein [Magnetococcales bacterium]|nr:DnaJ domain-containing protein [Magnetococcales bacterium]
MNLSSPWRTMVGEGIPGVHPENNSVPPGMRRVQTRCQGCGQSLGILYPEAVTRWKVPCSGCGLPIAIELVGGKRCLVFQVRGTRTVERIGLTDQRRRFFRARCFTCDEHLVVPEPELGRLRSCHRCGLEYLVRADGEVYYETTVRINDELTTYRDKVQEFSGYVAQKQMAFFPGEEVPSAVRKAERHPLAERGQRSEEGVQTRLSALQAELSRMMQEREQWLNRLEAHGAAVRALDDALASATRLKARIRELEEEGQRNRVRLHTLEEENARLVLKIAACEQPEKVVVPESVWSRSAQGGEITELRDEEGWYCEEGEEGYFGPDNAIGAARRLLGIKGQPTVARIKTAFRRRVKRYHPDVVAALGLELRELAHRKMQEINRAYGVLMKEYGHGT